MARKFERHDIDVILPPLDGVWPRVTAAERQAMRALFEAALDRIVANALKE